MMYLRQDWKVPGIKDTSIFSDKYYWPVEAGKGQRTFIPGRNIGLFGDLKCIITCP